MPIALNMHLEIRPDPKTGEPKLFGKCGYQVPTPKTNQYILMNLAAIERSMEAGELTDEFGKVVKDGAVILLPTRVSLIKASTEREQVSTIRTLDGVVNVPASAETSAEPDPF